jgi:hypothetical protein
MNFDVGVSACGAIGDNQARKLDTKRIYTRGYMLFSDILVGNHIRLSAAPFRQPLLRNEILS